MDLHVVGPAATPDERAAIDAVLDPLIGPARSGWDGGMRDTALDGHVAHGGHHARAHRNLLLPALNAAAVARRLGEPRGAQPHLEAAVRAARRGLWRRLVLRPHADDAPGADRRPRVRRHRVPPRRRGADLPDARDDRRATPARQLGDGGTTWLPSPCLGQCERAPAVLVTVAGPEPGGLVVGEIEDAEAVVDTLGWVAEVAKEGPARVHAELRDVPAEPLEWVRGLAPQAGDDGLVLLARVGRVDPTSLDAYRASGGYEALSAAMSMGPRPS